MSSHVSVPPGREQHSTAVKSLPETPSIVMTAEALHGGVDIEHVMKAPCHL